MILKNLQKFPQAVKHTVLTADSGMITKWYFMSSTRWGRTSLHFRGKTGEGEIWVMNKGPL